MSGRRMISVDFVDPGTCLLTMMAEPIAIETVPAAVQERDAIAEANRPRRATVVVTVTVSMARAATCATAIVQETDVVVKMTLTVQILIAIDATVTMKGVIAYGIVLAIAETGAEDVTPATLATLAVAAHPLLPRRTRTTVMSVQFSCNKSPNRVLAANCRSSSNRWELLSMPRS
jgi:hypothetical protein